MGSLKTILSKETGRDSSGRVVVRHKGGQAQKRFLREIDFKRDKKNVWGVVESVEYDPNRNAKVALVIYADGERRYILAPEGMEAGKKVIASDNAPLEVGNALPIENIPFGTSVHNLEIRPGKGGQIVRGAGNSASIQGKENKFVLIKLPSGEIRRFDPKCFAAIGQVGNSEIGFSRLGKAGRKRNKGIRPTVRGVAQHPDSHPHGGGEGRSGVGLKYPKTPWGKPAVGKTRRAKKYSDHLIVHGRKKGPHVG